MWAGFPPGSSAGWAALKAADAVLGNGNPAAANAATLNTQTTTLPAQDIKWSQIRDILMNNFDWGSLSQCAVIPVGGILPGTGIQTVSIQEAAVAIRECCIYGNIFAASVQANWTKLTTAAGLLTPATVGGISSATANAVLALRTPVVPTWDPPVTDNDVTAARGK